MNHVRKNRGDLVSGGERRRTEIARALAVDPKFILLDEPFAGIDPIAVEDIQTVVAKLRFKFNANRSLTLESEGAEYYHGARAYFDGRYFKVAPLKAGESK